MTTYNELVDCKDIIQSSLMVKNEVVEDYHNLDMNQFEKIIDGCKVVFVEVPDQISNLVENEGMQTIFIEVPSVVAEETVGSYCDTPVTNYNRRCETDETDPLSLKNATNCEDIEAVESTEKPKIAVKKLDTLLSPCKTNQSQLVTKTKDRAVERLNRISRMTPEKKTSSLELESKDAGKSDDLLWLLNFRLDDLIKTNAWDEPAPKNKSTDAKKYENGSNGQTKTKPNCESGAVSEHRKKPPFTYTELIECALQEKGPLTVSEIYQWISETFPYYKAWDDRWKNSVRHNLSINPYFRKGSKARQGSGHLWTVSMSADNDRSWSLKRQRYQEFVAYTKRIRLDEGLESGLDSEALAREADLEAAREAELAAANIEDKENREVVSIVQRDFLLPSHPQSHAIEQSAGEILSGIKRDVAVEYIEPPKPNTDFLNPVSKEVLMGECGFLSQIELNLTAEADHTEIVESEQVFEHFDDLGFQFTDVANQCPQFLSLVN